MTVAPSPSSSFLALIAAHAASDRPALVDDRGTVGYAELLTRAARAAGRLGPLAGGRVAILARQDADWVAAFLAVLACGGVAVPLSPAYPPAELAWFAAAADAARAIVSADLLAQAADLAAGRQLVPMETLFDGAPAPL